MNDLLPFVFNWIISMSDKKSLRLSREAWAAILVGDLPLSGEVGDLLFIYNFSNR